MANPLTDLSRSGSEVIMKLEKIFRLAEILCIVFFLAACSSKVPSSPFVDLSAPHVNSSMPSNNAAGVPSGSSIRINFSENINQSLFNTSSLVIAPVIPYSFQWDGNALVIQPSGALPSGEKFFVTVKAGIKDKHGNSSAVDYSFKFRISGTNLSQAVVTFKVDASSAKSSYPALYFAGTWDGLGDYDTGWNKGVRYALYDDGLHGDGSPGDGVWATSLPISVDLQPGHNYIWAVDDDNDPNNGYIRSATFSVISSAPATVLQTLHPPMPFTFVYHDLEGKVTGPIYLRGDVNGWSMNNQMTGPAGVDRAFSCTLNLKEGTYNYKYFTDNSWDIVNDGANRQVNVVFGSASVQNDYDGAGTSVTVNYHDVEGKVVTSVYLKGDFNGWSDANLMSGPVNGIFTTTVRIKAGTSYNYKFFCDGDWNKLNVDNRNLNLAAGVSTVDDFYSGPHTITFNYYDLEGKVTAGSIYLRGDMNGWGLDYGWQMIQDKITNYKYSLTKDLNEGTYSYKYFVNGDYGLVNIANRSITVGASNPTYTHDIYAGY